MPLCFHPPPPPTPISRSLPLLRRFCTSTISSDDHQSQAEHHYSHLLQRCSRASDLRLGASVHALLLKLPLLSSSLFLQNHILNMYFKCSPSSDLALLLFDEMPRRNIVTWSAAIAGLVRLRHPDHAVSLFVQMRHAGFTPNEFTLVSTLNASSLADGSALAPQMYAQVIKLGFESNVFLVNAFLTALIRSGRFVDAVNLFEKIMQRDVVSWNSMIAGYLQFAYQELWSFWCRMIREGVSPDEFSFSSVLTGLAAASSLAGGLQVHGQLVKHGFIDDICAGNSLVDMYLKNGAFDDGFKAFDEMPQRDVVSWTLMASGCLLFGQPSKALEVVQRMKLAGVRPNKFTLATIFMACSNLVSLEEGRKAHGFRIKLGIDVDSCVDNALLDMYAKCGSMDSAWTVFQRMEKRSVISWTTMIMGFAQNGLPSEALKVFDRMISEDVKPNHITFICVLYACSQGGFMEEGLGYFETMRRDHGIEPGEDHYACMVDLLGKAGRMAEAEALILNMPFKPGILVWQTLLGACKVHGDVETGKRAVAHAIALDKQDPSTYLLMSNMFADTSNWDGVGRVRELMEDWEVKKMPGSSWIEVMKGGNYPLMSEIEAFV